MRYVDRDVNGDIVAHYFFPQRPGQELIAEDHPDMIALAERMAAREEQDRLRAVGG